MLLDTGTVPLYEATSDGFWGTGFPFNSKSTVEEKGNGENRLGHILMAIRAGYSLDCTDREYDQSSVDGSTCASTHSQSGVSQSVEDSAD